MRQDELGKAKQVTCPKCKAEPGQRCLDTRTGRKFVAIVHRERVNEYERRNSEKGSAG